MSVTTRWATERDVPFLGEIVLLASRSHLPRGVWDLALSDDELRRRFIERLLVTGAASWCHWTKFRVAEVDGTPAAALSGYAEDEADMLGEDQAIATAFAAVGLDGPAQAAVFEGIGAFLTCLMPPIDARIIECGARSLPRPGRPAAARGPRRGRRGRGRARSGDRGNVTAQRAMRGSSHEARHRGVRGLLALRLHRLSQRRASPALPEGGAAGREILLLRGRRRPPEGGVAVRKAAEPFDDRQMLPGEGQILLEPGSPGHGRLGEEECGEPHRLALILERLAVLVGIRNGDCRAEPLEIPGMDGGAIMCARSWAKAAAAPVMRELVEQQHERQRGARWPEPPVECA
jgi:hypothetical protein